MILIAQHTTQISPAILGEVMTEVLSHVDGLSTEELRLRYDEGRVTPSSYKTHKKHCKIPSMAGYIVKLLKGKRGREPL